MKKGKYPLDTEPLYKMVPRIEYEFMKNAVAELEKTKKELKGEVVAWVSETRMYCKSCRPNYLFTNINWSFKTNEKSR